jgi:hypothetical protein
VRGLLADLPRKNCWTLAEHAGDSAPDGMQHLLAGAVWDADAVRDDVRDYVLDHLGDPEAVLVVDESGDCKKGTHTTSIPPPPGVIALSCNEIAHLFAVLVLRPAGDLGHRHRLRWSWWRRRHQGSARASHYRRRAAQQP